MDNIINESLIPMGFNFQQAKQSMYGPTDDTYQNYNPMVNMNDPMVAHAIKKQKEREALSARMQNEQFVKAAATKVLGECMQSIDNLITGNKRIGFTYEDSIILYNSIKNKCNEILNKYATSINNDILIEQAQVYQNLYSNQYSKDVVRYKLEWASNTIGFNTNEGIVKFNPNGLYDIVCSWCYAHQSHGINTDTMIFG